MKGSCVASRKKAGRARWRGIPVVLKVLALCMIALVALLVLLPAPPDNKPGGVTTITRRVPALRDTVDPLAKAPAQTFQERVYVPAPSTPPQPPPVVVLAPEPAPPPQPQPQPQPPAPPLRKPAIEHAGIPAPVPQWSPQIQEPPRQQTQDVARLPAEPTPEAEPGRRAGLPSKSEIREWVKSQAWEFLGGVDTQGNILYRFEVWLEAPPEIISTIKSVSYEYDAPSATPKSRASEKAIGGFRARFGSLACAKEITITVTMSDGRSRRTVADGCQALN